MKKKVLSVFVAVAMVITMMPMLTIPSNAAVFSGNGWSFDNGTLTVTTNSGTANWRSGRGTDFQISDVMEVIIGSGVQAIWGEAFWGTSITSIEIGSGVTSIHFGALKGLAEIIVDENNFNFSSRDGVLFNKNQTSLIQYPTSNTRIHYTIPDSVTSIERGAFQDSTSLATITIGNYVTTIEESAFSNCNNLISIIVNENNPYFSSWDGVLFNKNYTLLIQYPINNSRVHYEIIHGVTRIGGWAFDGCTSLESIFIPSSVTQIGAYPFRNCNNLSEIIVDVNNPNFSSRDGVLFNKNQTLLIKHPINNARRHYTIPGSVRNIGSWAFEGCISLESIIIPNGVISIGWGAFAECISLESIIIPDSVINMSDEIFRDCISLKAVTIGSSVIDIGFEAFSGCTSLESIIIPDSVAVIGPSAFQNCTSLESILIRGNIESIEVGTFENCTSLLSIAIPDSVINIDHYAFRGCTSLESVTIGNGVKSIGWLAFADCISLKSITVPDSVESIGSGTFLNCTSLESVIIGSGVTSIGSGAFSNCKSLKTMTFKGLTPPSLPSATPLFSAIFGDYPHPSLTTIYVPLSAEATYEDALRGLYIDSSVEIIETEILTGSSGINVNYSFNTANGTLTISGNGAMMDYDFQFQQNPPSFFTNSPWSDYSNDIKKIIIEYGVTSIGYAAFAYCINLESIIIPYSVISIGHSAFVDCTSLSSVIIPNSVKSIGADAFRLCISLESIIIPDSVTSIGHSAFSWCTSLETIIIPDSVTSIGGSAFQDCTSLESVTFISSTPPSFGSNVFQGASALSSIYVPWGANTAYGTALSGRIASSVEIIGNGLRIGSAGENVRYTFNHLNGTLKISGNGAMWDYDFPPSDANRPWHTYRSSIKTVIIENGVTSIGNWVFSDCSSLELIIIPDSVTNVGNWAFSGCSSLESIIIPDSVTNIGHQAFSNCLSLESIVIGSNVTSIGSFAFWNCTSLKSIKLPNGVTSIGDRVFQGCILLESVIIPDSVTTIGDRVFQDCTSLESVTIGSGVTSMGQRIFQGCTSLKSVIIKNGVTHIGIESFMDAKSLESIIIPDSVTSIGNRAFLGCTSLESVTIGSGVTSMGERVFQGCTSLKSVIIKNGVTRIGIDIFQDCTSLESIIIPSSVTNIGSGSFRNFVEIIVDENNLNFSSRDGVLFNKNQTLLIQYPTKDASKYYTILESVTSIDFRAFYGCVSLESITIGGGVTNIDGWAFENTPSLKFVTFKRTTPPSFGSNVFLNTPVLTTIYVPLCANASYETALSGRIDSSVEIIAVYCNECMGCQVICNHDIRNNADCKACSLCGKADNVTNCTANPLKCAACVFACGHAVRNNTNCKMCTLCGKTDNNANCIANPIKCGACVTACGVIGHSYNEATHCTRCTGCGFLHYRTCVSNAPCIYHACTTHTPNTTNCIKCNVCEEYIDSAEHNWSAWTAGGDGCIRTCGNTCNQTQTHAVYSNNENYTNCAVNNACNTCNRIVVSAGNHNIGGAWLHNSTHHWQKCQNNACTHTSTPIAHTPKTNNCTECQTCAATLIASCTTTPHCTACQAVCAPHTNRTATNCTACANCGAIGLGSHTFTADRQNQGAGGHDYKCTDCTTRGGLTAHTASNSAAVAENCTVNLVCVCEYIITAGAVNHVPITDNCRECTNCTTTGLTTCATLPKCAACQTACVPHTNRTTANCTVCADCGVTGLNPNCDDTCNYCKCDHNIPDIWTLRTAPTCTAEGIEFKRCIHFNECGHEVTQPINAIGHNFGAWGGNTATCTAAGIESRNCTHNCGEAGATETQPTIPLNHDMPLTWTLRTAPNCGVAGEEFMRCSRFNECNHEVTQQITALLHTWVMNGDGTHSCTTTDGCGIINQTCSPTGNTGDECDKCKYITPDPVCQHTSTIKAIYLAPTCTIDGKENVSCNYCGGIISSVPVPATGHKPKTDDCTACYDCLVTLLACGICDICDPGVPPCDCGTCEVCKGDDPCTDVHDFKSNDNGTHTCNRDGCDVSEQCSPRTAGATCSTCGYRTPSGNNTTGNSGGGGGGSGGSSTPTDETTPTTTQPIQQTAGTTTLIVSIPRNIINTINENIPVHQLKVNTAGTVAVNKGTNFAGQNAILVRFNAETNELEFVSASTVGTNGSTNINVRESGDYLVLTFKTGDITGTGEVQTADALALLRHIAGISELNSIQQFVANGQVGENNTADALNILRYIAGVINKI
jgi:hypothetical protein